MSAPFNAAGCPAGENLKPYLDGELGLLERLSLQRHLAACAACAEELRALQRLGTALRGLEGAAAPPPGLRERVMAGLEFQPEREDRRVSRYDVFRWGAVAATGIIAVAAGYGALAPEISQPQQRAAAAPSAAAVSTPAALATGGPPAAGAPTVSAPMGGAGPVLEEHEASGTFVQLRSEDPASAAAQRANGNEYANSIVWPEDLRPRAVDIGVSKARKKPKMVDGMPASIPAAGVVEVTPEDVQRYTRGKELEDVKRKVKQNGDLSVRVNRKLEEVQDSVAERVKRDGGYVEDSRLTAPAEGERTSQMRLRVPVEKFEAALAWLSSLGEVRAKNVTGEDITGTWIDQRAEVRELRAEEARLLGQFRKAKNNAEREAARCGLLTVRPRIAAAEERFALTGKLAALATVDLTLTEEPQARVQGNLMRDLDDTSRRAVTAFLAALRIPASLLIWLGVFSPLWLPCVLLYRWATRRAAARRLERFDPEAAAELGY